MYDGKTVWTDWMPCGVAVLVDGRRGPEVSLTLSPNVLPDSPMYGSGQFMWGPVDLYIMPLFCSLWSLSLGTIRGVLTVFVPLECTSIPLFLHDFLNLSPNP